MVTLTPDTIDDLIYSARAGELQDLQTDLTTLATQTSTSPAHIIAAAIDTAPQEEGGSGSSLLHYPAANGNLEILTYLLTTLTTLPSRPEITKVLNHRNYSGNTPLHWAALNTHLECVKALVEAGADVGVKNDAGLDAVFLAERADWKTQEEGGAEDDNGDEEVEVQIGGEGGEQKQDAGEMTRGRQVVEWLLSSEKAAESLEKAASKDKDEKKGEEEGGEKMDTTN
ncbi:ankyrin [Aspergillus vadensis CBS 113365]|uniref:Ankyrin n=1 Tax=Aspergillus vadensis (strain CBS 113365 / IMI 142717 / IBT 24658) TaxID=1448311 RepID=A0A319BW05_ASPVC|nr:ankyrin [Aspergillus vadensis CBS 113365]PYH70053.1 ankyrin [Aspergillus vadensis CBS 113365]